MVAKTGLLIETRVIHMAGVGPQAKDIGGSAAARAEVSANGELTRVIRNQPDLRVRFAILTSHHC